MQPAASGSGPPASATHQAALPLVEDPRLERWEDVSEWPLLGAAVVFLVAYALPILVPELSAPWPGLLAIVTWTAWALFAADYLARLVLSRRRRLFFRTHILDLLIVVLPVLRPLRLLRLVTLLSVLNKRAGASLRGRVGLYAGSGTALVMLVAALALLDAERDAAGSMIHNIGDSAWWAFATVTTVGYGDLVPVTTVGRAIATGLMLIGIAMLGVVTATFASWLVERAQAQDEETAATRRDIEALTEQVRRLRAELKDLPLR